METIFDIVHPEECFQKIKTSPSLESFLEELFIIGKLTEKDSLKLEIQNLLSEISDTTVVKAFKSRTKIPNTGASKDYDGRINALVAFAKTTPTLNIGKMFMLLALNSEFRTDLVIKEKSAIDKNPALLARFNGVSEITIWDAFDIGLPDGLGQITSLEKLEINSSHIKRLPASLGNLSNLIALELRISTLKEIPDTLKQLQKLETLRIEGNHYSDSEIFIPEWIGELKNLKTLDLRYLSNESLPEKIFPESLNSVYLAHLKNLKKIPDSLVRCVQLKSLRLATSPSILYLPAGMENLKELEELKLSLSGLKEISGDLLYAPQIKTLQLSNLTAPITEPEPKINNRKDLSIGNVQYLLYFLKNTTLFPELESLKISLDSRETFPEGSLSGLKKLKSVEFYYQAPHSILESLKGCTTLETLNIYNVNNTSLPDLSSLNSLRNVFTHYCQELEISLAKLPRVLTKLHLKFPKSLDFASPHNLAMDQFIVEGASLLHFSEIGNHRFKTIEIYINETALIDGNKTIPSLPESISQLHDLESFKINAPIEHIPDCFSSLPYLRQLALRRNNYSTIRPSITSIEESVFSGKSLRYCELENYSGNVHPLLQKANALEEIHLDAIETLESLPDLRHLKSLKKISLRNCDRFISLKHVPDSLASLGLYMCRNVSADLYHELASLTQLKEVYLKFLSKEINRFPEEWNFLEILEMDHLDIHAIPPSVEKFSNLKRLGVDGLFIRTLPKELANLKYLKQLGIKSTYLTDLPIELLALQLDEVRMWFSKFAGNNLKREIYSVLINTNTKIVKEFGGEEYYWASREAYAHRKTLEEK